MCLVQWHCQLDADTMSIWNFKFIFTCLQRVFKFFTFSFPISISQFRFTVTLLALWMVKYFIWRWCCSASSSCVWRIWFGVSGLKLVPVISFLHTLFINGTIPEGVPCSNPCSAFQCFVIRSLLFSLCTIPQSVLLSQREPKHHLYVDDPLLWNLDYTTISLSNDRRLMSWALVEWRYISCIKLVVAAKYSNLM